MAGRKDGSSKQIKREAEKAGGARGQTEASRGTTGAMAESRGDTAAQNRRDQTVTRSEAAQGGSDVTPPKGRHAGASTGAQRATTVGKGEVLPQSQQSAQDECPPNPDDRND